MKIRKPSASGQPKTLGTILGAIGIAYLAYTVLLNQFRDRRGTDQLPRVAIITSNAGLSGHDAELRGHVERGPNDARPQSKHQSLTRDLIGRLLNVTTAMHGPQQKSGMPVRWRCDGVG